MSLLEVGELTVEFGSGGYIIKPLDHLCFSASDGELVVLLGPSGCGKTTLLSCLAGLLTPTSGQVRFGTTEVTSLTRNAMARYRRETVGVVFQGFNLIASLSARGNVMVPLLLAGVRRRDCHGRADGLLDTVGLTERSGHRPAQMSGGQQQRVAIARALVHDPPLLLADEPTAHLDYIQVEGILKLIRAIASPGRLVVVATHDDRVTRLADRVIELVPHMADVEREPREVCLTTGDILFEQGDASDLVYVVESGSMEIYRRREVGDEESITTVGAGGYFGELGPMLDLPRSASARAREATRLTGYPVRLFRRLDLPARAGSIEGTPV